MSDPADEAALWARVRDLSRVPPWAGIERDRTIERELVILQHLRALADIYGGRVVG